MFVTQLYGSTFFSLSAKDIKTHNLYGCAESVFLPVPRHTSNISNLKCHY